MNARIGISLAVLAVLFQTSTAHSLEAAQAAAGQIAAPSAAAAMTQDAQNDLSVSVGKSVLVDCPRPVERVAVGAADLAEVTAVSPTEIMLNGKAPGETTLIIWQVGGSRQFFNVTVRPSSFTANDHLDALRRELRTELPGQTLRVTQENGTVFLRGTVKDLNSSERAVQIASTAGKVVNLLYVNVPAPEKQILLKVRFASVDRSISRQLGLNIYSTGAANSIGVVSTQQFSAPTVTGTNPVVSTLSNALNLSIFRPDLNLGATLEALETKGLVQVLAEPNLLTENGKQGSFLAGGQYPFPVVQGTTGGGGSGAVTIQFKEFGVRVNFIPTVTPRGTIHLQVAPEVSSLDTANGVTVSGFTVPGLDIRRVKTEVELSTGQSFAISGLLDNRDTKTLSKIPFIGDIPVLGKFFQSQTKTRTNTELIVIVTPEIVEPVPAGSIASPNYPDKFMPPNSTTSMATPGGDAASKLPAAATMPVEQLIQSLKAPTALVVDANPYGNTGGSGSSSSGGGGSGASTGSGSSTGP